MIGAGPEMIHESGPDHGTVWGISSVLDFMFWPKKNAGWYLLAWNGDGDSCAAASKAWTWIVFDECRPRLAQRNRGAGDRGVQGFDWRKHAAGAVTNRDERLESSVRIHGQ